jgi:hypothetical protein
VLASTGVLPRVATQVNRASGTVATPLRSSWVRFRHGTVPANTGLESLLPPLESSQVEQWTRKRSYSNGSGERWTQDSTLDKTG